VSIKFSKEMDQLKADLKKEAEESAKETTGNTFQYLLHRAPYRTGQLIANFKMKLNESDARVEYFPENPEAEFGRDPIPHSEAVARSFTELSILKNYNLKDCIFIYSNIFYAEWAEYKSSRKYFLRDTLLFLKQNILNNTSARFEKLGVDTHIK
jgi:hypothetical protein